MTTIYSNQPKFVKNIQGRKEQRHSMLVIMDDRAGELVKFKEESIPGLLSITRRQKLSDGKSTAFHIETSCQTYLWVEDWQWCLYINEESWTEAWNVFRTRSKMNVSLDAFKAFVRLDSELSEFAYDLEVGEEYLIAQQAALQLRKEKAEAEEAERLRKSQEALEKITDGKGLKGRFNLEDLQHRFQKLLA